MTARTCLSEQETRQRLLDLAVQRLVDEGLGVGLDAIRVEKLITEAGVSRASAYRYWPRRDDFLADALVETVRRTTLIPEGSQDLARLQEILTAHDDQLDTETGRRQLVVEALRVSIDADVRRLLASPHWRVFMALATTHQALPDDQLRETVGQALVEMERAFVERRAEVYQGLTHLIGYRQRQPWQGREGFVALSELAGLTMRGILSRALTQPDWLDERSEMTPFGGVPAAWSQAEVALAQVLLTHLEPDPTVDWTPERINQARQDFAATARSLGA
ncbi:hypothetical protein GCM10027030_09510 [Luteococcus sediminum]